jgi:hypothetical protein
MQWANSSYVCQNSSVSSPIFLKDQTYFHRLSKCLDSLSAFSVRRLSSLLPTLKNQRFFHLTEQQSNLLLGPSVYFLVKFTFSAWTQLNQFSKNHILAGQRWLTSVILTTLENRSRGLCFKASPRLIVHETLSQKCPTQKRAGGVAQVWSPEFKSQYQQQ